MTTNALRQEVAEKVEHRLTSIKVSAERRVVYLQEVRQQRFQHERYLAWRRARRDRRRAGLILTGIKAVSELGQTPEFQALMPLSGGHLTIWGDDIILPSSRDMDRYERVVALALYPEYVRISDLSYLGESQAADIEESMDICIQYGSWSEYSTSLWLRNLIVQSPAIDFNDHELMNMKDAHDSRDMLWQVVAECANPKKLERYIRNVI